MSKRLEMFDTMIAKGSQDPFVHYARAMEFRSLERLQESLDAFDAVAATYPDYVPTYLMAAQVAEALSKIDDARTWCERGLEAAKRAGDGHAAGELQAQLDDL